MALGQKRTGVSSGLPVPLSQLAGAAGGALQPKTERRLITLDMGTASAQSNAADGTGIMDAVFPIVPADRVWLIERVNISSTSTTTTQATAYTGQPVAANQVDLSKQGEGDVADEINPILVGSTSAFRLRWTGASLGAVGTVTIQYREAAFSDVAVR
jgi:hypothetical protein